MSAYYKLVNRKTKERIEPSEIGGGWIKFGAMVEGPSAKLLMWLHIRGQSDWTVLCDMVDEYEATDTQDSPFFLVNATEKYRIQFNQEWSEDGRPADGLIHPHKRSS